MERLFEISQHIVSFLSFYMLRFEILIHSIFTFYLILYITSYIIVWIEYILMYNIKCNVICDFCRNYCLR